MIEYSLEESGIFVIRFVGEIGIEEIKEYLKKFKNISNLPKEIKILYDLSDAEMTLSKKDIQTLNNLSILVTQKYDSVKAAFVVNKPNITAYSLMFSEKAPSSKTIRKVFSTEIAARDWLTL